MKKGNFYTPDEVFEKFLNWFDIKKRLAFIVAFIVGVITHINMITDLIMSQDGLWNSIQYFKPGNWEVTLGRWGIVLIQRLNNFIAIPNLTTVSCILIMSIVAVIIVDLFDLKSKLSIVISSCILVVSPSFLVTLLYVYTALSYCACMLFSCLAVWALYKLKNKRISYIASGLFFILSLSIYQSYAGLSIGLYLMVQIVKLIKRETKVKDVFISILKTGAFFLVAGIIYLVITKLVLYLFVLEMAEYKNADGFSIINILISLKNSLLYAYKDFFAFFFRDRIIYNTNYRREVFFGILFISSSLMIITHFINSKYETKKEKVYVALTCLILLLIIPLALNIIDLIMSASEVYVLTAGQMIVVIPFIFALVENIEKYSILKWAMVLSSFCIIGTYYIADNASYTALKLTYNQALNTTERIINRIEETPGFDKSYPIVLGGIVGNTNFPRTSNIYDFTIGAVVNNTTFHGTYGGQIGTWVSFVKIYFGLDIIPANEGVYFDVITSEEYKNMEEFPGENSVKIRDGIIIVKLNDDPPLPF